MLCCRWWAPWQTGNAYRVREFQGSWSRETSTITSWHHPTFPVSHIVCVWVCVCVFWLYVGESGTKRVYSQKYMLCLFHPSVKTTRICRWELWLRLRPFPTPVPSLCWLVNSAASLVSEKISHNASLSIISRFVYLCCFCQLLHLETW